MINKDHILYLCISAIGILYLSQLIQKFEYSADDTFIYLQYARNVVSGNGFSFNPGEPSYGVTSPLWVFILTFAYFLNVNPFWFAKSADLLFAVLSCIMFFRLTGFFFRNDIYLRSAAMLMFCLNPWFVRWTFTGMETSLAVFLVISIFYFYYSERFDFMFFLLGLVFLVRPETFVLTIILALFVFFRKISESKFSPREVLLWGILFATSVLPFLIYAKFSFGTIIPNTASGKSTFTFSFNTIVNQLWHILKTLAGASLPELLLSMVFLLFAIQKRNTLKTLSLMFWISGLVFLYVITDADVISRYLLVISPFLIILGLNTVLISGDFRYKLCIIVIICSLLYSQFVFYKFVKPSTDDFTAGLNECFKPLGIWIRENTPQNSRIFLNDVGVVGYYSQRYIIDAAALINRDLNLNRKIMSFELEKRAYPHKMLDEVVADYIIERDVNEENVLQESGNYRFELKLIKKFPSLGIRDSSPRYYKLYKVIKKN